MTPRADGPLLWQVEHQIVEGDWPWKPEGTLLVAKQLLGAVRAAEREAERWEAIARQLGDALERHARMAAALLAQQPVRDAPETIAEVNRALSVYRDAIKEDG